MLPGIRPRFLPVPLKGRGAGRNMVAGHTLFLSGEKMMSRMVVFYLKCAHMTCLSLDVVKDRTAAPPFAPGGICRGWAAGVPSVPWNLPESGFCRADAQMAWLCCLGDCFGDATWAAWSNLRRPRHSTADRLLSGFRVSSFPRIGYFRAGRADPWRLCVHPRCRADTSPTYAAISQFACAGNACRNHTGLKDELCISQCVGNTHWQVVDLSRRQ